MLAVAALAVANTPRRPSRNYPRPPTASAPRSTPPEGYARIVEPSPDIEAHPRESNILEWHFVIKGPKDTPAHGGHYHGKLVFPPDYPYKPPSIMMLTPSGRFRTNMRIRMSMSDFHPETWVPAWSVASILNGVLSFMLEETTTVGSMEASADERKRLAQAPASRSTGRRRSSASSSPTSSPSRPPPPLRGEEGGADGAGGGADGADADGDGDARAQSDGWLLTAACGAVALAAVAYAAWGLWERRRLRVKFVP